MVVPSPVATGEGEGGGQAAAAHPYETTCQSGRGSAATIRTVP